MSFFAAGIQKTQDLLLNVLEFKLRTGVFNAIAILEIWVCDCSHVTAQGNAPVKVMLMHVKGFASFSSD
jgi:hypothetical protein